EWGASQSHHCPGPHGAEPRPARYRLLKKLLHRLGIDGHAERSGKRRATRRGGNAPSDPRLQHDFWGPGGAAPRPLDSCEHAGGGGSVNSTARWPERLAHIAALLRAEGAAVLATSGDSLIPLFTHRLSPDIDWRAMLEPDLISRALAGAPSGMAVAAGRWDDQAGFALLASIEVT